MVKATDTKDDLKNYLIKDYEIDEKELENKTKKELWDMLKTLNDENLDNLVEKIVEDENVAEKNVVGEEVPEISDYKWHDYVMSKFEKDELVDKNPTVDGMRRVCELLVGEITDIKSDVIQVPTVENERRATVKVTVIIKYYRNSEMSSYNGCADVYYGNADGVYGKHPVALAETRAEGRALKRALRLRKIVSAEEVTGDNESAESDIKSKDPINDNQKNFINFACSKERANINVEKLIKNKFPEIKSIKDLKYTQAQELVLVLDEYNRKQDTIPAEIRGYDSGWVTSFGG